MSANDGTSEAEQTCSVESNDSEVEVSASKSLISVLTAMQENLTSSNDMLRELLWDKRRTDSNSEIETFRSKRSKRDSNESSPSEKASEKAEERASEKAKTGTSQEVQNEASDEANNSAGSEQAAIAQIAADDDAISLFGYESSNSNEDEDEINNDALLTEITT